MTDSTLKASDKSKTSLKKIHDWIKAELDSETEMLWTSFLEYDETLEGKLDKEELKKMLQSFDTNATSADMDNYLKEILGETGKETSFPQLIDWWEKQKGASGVGLRSMLKARFAAQKLKSWSWDLISPKAGAAKRIEDMNEKAIQNSIEQYSVILVDIQKKHVAQSDTQLDAAEDAAIKKYEEHLKEESEKTSSGDMDDYDRYQLQKLFISYAGKVDGDLSQAKLGALCLCLGVDVPSSILRVTARKYPDPMKEADFRRWCHARGMDSASSLVNKMKGIGNMGMNVFSKK